MMNPAASEARLDRRCSRTHVAGALAHVTHWPGRGHSERPSHRRLSFTERSIR